MSEEASEIAADPGTRPAKKPYTLIIIKRATLFFLAICLLSLLFWYSGSFQSFLDSTQAMLMELLRLSALGLLFASALGIAFSAANAILRRYALRLGGLLAYLLLLGFGAVCLILSDALLILHAGIGS